MYNHEENHTDGVRQYRSQDLRTLGGWNPLTIYERMTGRVPHRKYMMAPRS